MNRVAMFESDTGDALGALLMAALVPGARVLACGLPEGAVILGAEGHGPQLLVKVHHPDFEDVGEGELIPVRGTLSLTIEPPPNYLLPFQIDVAQNVEPAGAAHGDGS